MPALLATPGTAGAWTFGASTGWRRLTRGWRTDHQYITVVYLDDDPLRTTGALAPLVEQRWQSPGHASGIRRSAAQHDDQLGRLAFCGHALSSASRLR
ncbi:hypothetical protein [Mycobacterium tilburgii]|uniref:hypothetical protein n=1 Tax=Mycobacterium tilburgii TaxID=44467 RepID=UPI001181EC7C|nr:hypothetical protein [Mycobacterium tilburgii]